MSTLLTNPNPALAVRLNPLNFPAAIRLLNDALQQRHLPADKLQELEALARRQVRLAPADGRAYSALAAILQKQRQSAQAEELFDKALTLAPAERMALAHVISRKLKAGQYEDAVQKLDILMRRWPDSIGKLRELLVSLASAEATQPLLRKVLRKKPNWRWRAILILKEDAGGRRFLQRMFKQEQKDGNPPLDHELDVVINAQLQAGEYASAHRLFTLFLPEQTKALTGLVFDPAFAFKPMRRAFAWQVYQVSDALTEYPSAREGHGLALSFYDAPAKLRNVHQSLLLPPGSYRLLVVFCSENLHAPQGLFWELRCRGKGGRRVKLQVPEGKARQQHLQQDFTIPEGCSAQTLILTTDVIAPSWRHRYRGRVVFHRVDVERVED